MTARKGQVALYLVMALVAITLLAVMNVSVFLAVRARNRTMNAGDSVALAVARHQGELLNRIGADNIAHLKAVVAGDAEACAEIAERQARTCFLGPLEGIRIGNEIAQENGAEECDEFLDVFKQHVIDIRTGYEALPEQYPEPWEGAWEEYAQRLELAIGGGLWAAPDNVDFIDAEGGHLLLNFQFYNAVAGRNWCWFHFNAPGALDSYSGFRDWGPLPTADDETRRRRCCNSEIYSLHLEARSGSALMLFGKDMILRLAGCTEEELEKSPLARDASQVWYFYGGELWRTWWEIDPDGEWEFPVVGTVKREYDVRGCAACCRVRMEIPDLLGTASEHRSNWTAAAKPFGTVQDEFGEVSVVTAHRGLVTPAFDEVRLVPWDSVGGRDTERPNLDMLTHVRKHLPRYLCDGPAGTSPGCYYCKQLLDWENSILRMQGREWLKYNSKSCVRSISPGSAHGGTAHGH